MMPDNVMPRPQTPTVLALEDQARRFEAAARYEPTQRKAAAHYRAAAELRLVAHLVRQETYTIQQGREWLRAAQITHHRIALARKQAMETTK